MAAAEAVLDAAVLILPASADNASWVRRHQVVAAVGTHEQRERSRNSREAFARLDPVNEDQLHGLELVADFAELDSGAA